MAAPPSLKYTTLQLTQEAWRKDLRRPGGLQEIERNQAGGPAGVRPPAGPRAQPGEGPSVGFCSPVCLFPVLRLLPPHNSHTSLNVGQCHLQEASPEPQSGFQGLPLPQAMSCALLASAFQYVYWALSEQGEGSAASPRTCAMPGSQCMLHAWFW